MSNIFKRISPYILVGCIALGCGAMALNARAAQVKEQAPSIDRSEMAAELIEAGFELLKGGEFPAYYGGSYHAGDDKLVVYLTDMNYSQAIKEFAGEYADAVVLRQAEFSLDRLKEYSAAIADELTAQGVKVTGCGVNEFENKAVIMVDPADEVKASEYVKAHYAEIPALITGMSAVDQLDSHFSLDTAND